MNTPGTGLISMTTFDTTNVGMGSPLMFNYKVEVSGNIIINPFIAEFMDFKVDQLNSKFSEFFQDSFTVLDNRVQFQDGDITLNPSFLNSLLGFELPQLAGLESLLTIELEGTGVLMSKIGNTSFSFNYVSDIKSIIVDEFNTDVVGGCLVGFCNAKGKGNLDISANFLLSSFNVVSRQGQLALSTTLQAAPDLTTWVALFGVGAWMLKKKVLQLRRV
jgi:hypothetical protein